MCVSKLGVNTPARMVNATFVSGIVAPYRCMYCSSSEPVRKRLSDGFGCSTVTFLPVWFTWHVYCLKPERS
jgi:hypothetical protein